MSVAAERCAACSHVGIEPRGFCPACGSRTVTAGTIPGDGTIRSRTEIHRPPSRDGAVAKPYVVGLIALDAGPRLMARIPGDPAIGDRVTVTRDALDGETTTVAAKPKG